MANEKEEKVYVDSVLYLHFFMRLTQTVFMFLIDATAASAMLADVKLPK